MQNNSHMTYKMPEFILNITQRTEHMMLSTLLQGYAWIYILSKNNIPSINTETFEAVIYSNSHLPSGEKSLHVTFTATKLNGKLIGSGQNLQQKFNITKQAW